MSMPIRYRPFGSFRFALALSVVVSHSAALDPAIAFLQPLGIGNIAVMGFFVLSGFIIAEASETFYRGRAAGFVSNRFWRIAPPYWVALIVSIAVHGALVGAGRFVVTDSGTPTDAMFTASNIWANFIAIFPRPRLLQGDVPGGFYGFVRFYWAVYIEVVFYLATFATMLLIRFSGRRQPIVEGIIGLALAAHVINEYVRPFSLHWEMAFTPYFALGVCMYALAERISAPAIVGAVVSYFLATLHFSRYIQGKVDLGGTWLSGMLAPEHAVALATFMLVPFLVVLLAGLRTSEKATLIDRHLGDLTYPIYLNHFIILVVAFSFGWRFAGVTLVIAALSIALSALLVVLVERPLKPLRDRIRGRDLALDSGVTASLRCFGSGRDLIQGQSISAHADTPHANPTPACEGGSGGAPARLGYGVVPA